MGFYQLTPHLLLLVTLFSKSNLILKIYKMGIIMEVGEVNQIQKELGILELFISQSTLMVLEFYQFWT